MHSQTWNNKALSPSTRAKLLLAELSHDEKMAQLGCVFPFGENAQDFDWIAFEVSPSFLAFLDRNMRWKIEKGAVEVQIGSSSEDVCLTGRFHICEDAWVKGESRSLVCSPRISEM